MALIHNLSCYHCTMRKITLRFRAGDKTFEEIRRGLKTIETRAATARYLEIKKGDVLVMACGARRMAKTVKRARLFKTIGGLLKAIPVEKIMPSAHSAAEARVVYYRYPGYKEKIKKCGLVAFDLL